MRRPDKLVLIGIDAAVPKFVRRMMDDGELPNLAGLASEGVWAENCLVPFPTVTPPNWTTIVTGAWPGTHGVMGFRIHREGEPLTKTYDGFDSRYCRAERLWEAAERAGKRSIILKYPCSWPPTVREGIQVDGCHFHECKHVLDLPHLFSTRPEEGMPKIELRPAEGWRNLPATFRRPLEAVLEFGLILKREIGEGRVVLDEFGPQRAHLYALVVGDAVLITRERDASDPVCTLKPGEWSPWIPLRYDAPPPKDRGMVRLKLLSLGKEKLRIYATNVEPVRGFTFPDHIGPELTEEVGPFLPNIGAFGTVQKWNRLADMGHEGEELFLDLVEYQNRWFGKAAKYLMGRYDWDLFFVQTHLMDCVHHLYLNLADPATNPDPESREHFAGLIKRCYRIADELIGELTEAAGEDALYVVVSDHGSIPHLTSVPIREIFERAGLLVWREEDAFARAAADQQTDATPASVRHLAERNWLERVDWERTRAVPVGPTGIYINLKGREPHGIVEPEEYEKLRDEIIGLLYDYTDPKTGKKPFTLVFKKEDARNIGLYGDTVGDIVYACIPESTHHGLQLSTADFSTGSQKGLLIIRGPGVKRGFVLERTAWLVDVVPTVCHLMELPVPAQCEGAVLYQVLES